MRASRRGGRLLAARGARRRRRGCGIATTSGFGGPRVLRRARAARARGRGVGARARARAVRPRACARPRRRERVRRRRPSRSRSRSPKRYGLRRGRLPARSRCATSAHEPAPRSARPASTWSPLGDRREELLRAAWPLAERGVRGHADAGRAAATRSRRGCATRRRVPGRLVRRARARRVVGYAGLIEHAEAGDGRARPDRRAPRRTAAAASPARSSRRSCTGRRRTGFARLVTWTQTGNERDAGAEPQPRLPRRRRRC